MATVIETRPLVDAEQDELNLVDAAFRRAFGPDMPAWDVEIRGLYNDAHVEVFDRYPTPVTQ